MKIVLFLMTAFLFSCAQNDSTAAAQSQNNDFENMPEVELKSEIDLFSETDQVTLLVIRNVRAEVANHLTKGSVVDLFNLYTKDSKGLQERSLSCYFLDTGNALPMTLQKGDKFVFQVGTLKPSTGTYFDTSIKALFFDAANSLSISVELNCSASNVNITDYTRTAKYMTFKELLLGIGDFMQIVRRR